MTVLGLGLGVAVAVAFIAIAPAGVETSTATLIAAGDIADCTVSGDSQTAAVVAGIPGTVITLGDNVYDRGTVAEFRQCYDTTWGAFKDRTRPAPGNHEYLDTPGALGYFGYFGARAGPGYYSYDRVGWHVVSLNSERVTAAQLTWLKADLAANDSRCTLAYFHHPRYDGSTKGDDPSVEPFWDALVADGADVVINGHAHNYQRFEPIRGIRQFIVGTGGGRGGFYPLQPDQRRDAAQASTLGVLEVDLTPTGYAWAFRPVAGENWTDRGTGTC